MPMSGRHQQHRVHLHPLCPTMTLPGPLARLSSSRGSHGGAAAEMGCQYEWQPACSAENGFVLQIRWLAEKQWRGG